MTSPETGRMDDNLTSEDMYEVITQDIINIVQHHWLQ